MKYLVIFIFIVAAASGGWFVRDFLNTSQKNVLDEVTQQFEEKRPLEKYTIDNLSQTKIVPLEIKLEDETAKEKSFTSYLFSMDFDPTLQQSEPTSKWSNKKNELKHLTGQINLPSGENKFPLVIMIRGYVDEATYETGTGTKNAAAYFAENGFITIAPDFLGYAGSSENSADIFESRFQTHTTVLALFSSLQSIESWNGHDIFIWAHSNGGQIALTTLEITKANYPTTLWAPVSKSFPYSILYYTDESDDKGKFIRSELAKFEELYDVNQYSLDEYFDRITAPIQIHQGTSDDAVPLEWSTELANNLKANNIEVNLFTYPGADHNLRPAWDNVIEQDLLFFKENLK